MQRSNDLIALMASNGEYLAIGVRKLKPEMFAADEYSTAFKLLAKKYRDNEPMSFAAMEKRMRALIEPDSTDKAFYDGLVESAICDWRKRQIALLVERANSNGDIDNDTLDAMIANIDSLRGDCEVMPLSGKELAYQAFDDTQRYITGEIERIPTNIDVLNDWIYGFEGGQFCVISAKTGAGKSAFAINLAAEFSCRRKIKTLYINTEMNSSEISVRLVSLLSDDDYVNINNIVRQNIQPRSETYQNYMRTIDQIKSSALSIHTIKFLTLAKLRETFRYAAKNGIKAIFVDYLGRIDKSKTMGLNMWDYFQLIAAELKTFAQLYNITIFVVSQLSKDGALAGASYIEHEADIHFQLRKIEKKDCDQLKYLADELHWNYLLEIKKHRNGRTGIIPCRFVGEKITFIFDGKKASEDFASRGYNVEYNR